MSDEKNEGDFRFVDFEDFPTFSKEHNSLMRKILCSSPELFQKLKNIKSNKGFTFSNVIQCGIVSPNLEVGAVAGDEHCYEVFKDFYAKIIHHWHGYDIDHFSQQIDLDYSKLILSDADITALNRYIE